MRISKFLLYLALITVGSVATANAQTTETQGLTATAAPATETPVAAGPERMINRQATPAGDELLLFAEPTETSKSLKISHWRQLFVRSLVDSTWCRALYGGTQFYVRRADINLLAPNTAATGRPKAPAKSKPRR